MTIFATVNGHVAQRAVVHVPSVGPWFADVDFAEDPDLSGGVTLALDALELVGTVDAKFSGTFGLQRRLRIVAGAGGWSSLVTPKDYHNDSGVLSRTVADDVAREVGETIGDFPTLRLGVHYVRESGPAARVLEDVIDGTPWWVGYDGKTNVGARASSDPSADYEVLFHDPRSRIVMLAIDDLRSVGIGTVLTEHLDSPQTVRELEIIVDENVRVRAWCGGGEKTPGRLVGLIRSIVERVVSSKIYGKRKYRVVRLSVNRVELQVVESAIGLPDALPISMWPGVAGAHADLTLGSEVLVEFIDGDRMQPIVTHFAGKDGNGWAPANLTFDAVTLIKLGASASQFVALAADTKSRLDTIQSTFDAHTHPYVAGVGAPIAGAPTPTPIGPLGPIAATKVKAE